MEHTENRFVNHQGDSLYCQSWKNSDSPKANILIVHGLAEHSGRYEKIAHQLVENGYAVFSYDQRGHGLTGGTRGYIKRFSDFTADLDAYVQLVNRQGNPTMMYIFGHSMGGTVTAVYAVTYRPNVAGFILSSPLLKVGDSVSKATIRMGKFLARILPHAGVASIESSAISRDAAVVMSYDADDLVYHGKYSARLGAEMLAQLTTHLPPRLSEIDKPVLLIHGTGDRLANPEGSRLAYQNIGSKDKTLRLYPGFFHETFNEPDGIQVMEDIVFWLDSHSRT